MHTTFKAQTPIVVIGTNKQDVAHVGHQLQAETGRELIYAEQLCWAIWAQSSVVKQKKIAQFGSQRLSEIFERSGKFSNQELLQNWIQAGIFSQPELEFMKLQLCNYLLKNFADCIICFGADQVWLMLPEFQNRLEQLFQETDATIIDGYTRRLS